MHLHEPLDDICDPTGFDACDLEIVLQLLVSNGACSAMYNDPVTAASGLLISWANEALISVVAMSRSRSARSPSPSSR